MLSACYDENERLAAEQAVLAYREVHQAMQAAPYGQRLMQVGSVFSADAFGRQSVLAIHGPPHQLTAPVD